jgi:hypothetical protein
MDKREVLTELEQGGLESIVQSLNDMDSLNDIHNVLFHKTLEVGVPRAELIRRIDDQNFYLAREARLEERELRQMNRKMMIDFDPDLAIAMYRAQIDVMLKSIEQVAADRERGDVVPEEDLFNTKAYGQTLSTVSADGVPSVAVFTGLARLDGSRVYYGHISATEAYENAASTKKAVFSAVGPSNDPTKNDFLTIRVELVENVDEGEEMEKIKGFMGPAVKNCLIFEVKEIRMSHLPKVSV